MWNKESVKNLRRSMGLTQTELATLLGCRQQTVSEWEQGIYTPANAYGKLLTQLQARAPGAFQTHKSFLSDNIPQLLADLESPAPLTEDPRPFDPAID